MADPKEAWSVELTFVRRTKVRYRVSADGDEAAVHQALRLSADYMANREDSPDCGGRLVELSTAMSAFHAELIEDEGTHDES